MTGTAGNPGVPTDPVRSGITLHGLAARLGVSAMTVSRALNGRPGVAEPTRRRVRAAAAALGYHPNAAARGLRAGRPDRRLVGLVVPGLADPACAGLAAGVERGCAERGLRVLLAAGHDRYGEADAVAELAHRGVDGLIVRPAGDDDRELAGRLAPGVPVVLAGRPPTGLDADCVLCDEAGAAFRACRQLARDGHRRIAYLGPIGCGWAESERHRGYLLALDAAGIAPRRRYVRRCGDDPDEAARVAETLLAQRDPPTALVAAGRAGTLGALRAARGGIAVVGFGVRPDEPLPCPVTAVEPDAVALGRTAVRLLTEPRPVPRRPVTVTVRGEPDRTGGRLAPVE